MDAEELQRRGGGADEPLGERLGPLGLVRRPDGSAFIVMEMLVGQAAPSFEAIFGVEPPAGVDVRALCLQALKWA